VSKSSWRWLRTAEGEEVISSQNACDEVENNKDGVGKEMYREE